MLLNQPIRALDQILDKFYAVNTEYFGLKEALSTINVLVAIFAHTGYEYSYSSV